jgi:hypothetical protein
MNYLKGGEGVSRQHDEAMEIGRPLTPKSERQRTTWGSLLVSVQTSDGLCSNDRKCVRKDGHNGQHWPTEGGSR